MIKYKHNSRYLTEKQVNNVWATHQHFIECGLTLIKHITIDFAKALDDENINIQLHTSKLLNQMRKWHKRHSIPFSYIWVIENKGTNVGLHAHIALYSDICHFDELNDMITRWLPFKRDDLDAPNAIGTNIKVKPVPIDSVLINYLCKGIDARVECGKGTQGYVIGRRWGYCRTPFVPQ